VTRFKREYIFPGFESSQIIPLFVSFYLVRTFSRTDLVTRNGSNCCCFHLIVDPCEILIASLCCCRRLPSTSCSLSTLPDPGIVGTCVQRGVVPECSSLLEITAFHQPSSPHSRPQPSIRPIDPRLAERESYFTERLSCFLVRLTVALRPLLCKGLCRYGHKDGHDDIIGTRLIVRRCLQKGRFPVSVPFHDETYKRGISRNFFRNKYSQKGFS